MPVSFALVPVVIGMMGHMMNSVVLALIFAPLFGRYLHSQIMGAVVGSLYALAIFFAMWFVVLPLIDPVMLKLNPLVFALSHMLWGVVLGVFVARRASQ
jgi:small-conductance mechanosensitive channel